MAIRTPLTSLGSVLSIQYRDEYFKFTVRSDSSAQFNLPTGSKYGDGQTYNWIVEWGDGTTTEETGIGSYNDASHISHTYPLDLEDYQITIRQKNKDEKKWLQCFGFSTLSTSNRYLVSLDSPFTIDMFSDDGHSVGNYCFNQIFYNCTTLTMNENTNFNIPQEITNIGDDFCRDMFRNAHLAKLPSNFNIPQNITTVGNYFCSGMFCDIAINFPLVLPDNFNLPPGIQNVGNFFCDMMFYNKPIETFPTNFGIPNGITDAKIGFFNYAFYNNSSLTSIPSGLTITNIKNVSGNFFYRAFFGNEKLKTGIINFFGNVLLPKEVLDNITNYNNTFRGCTAITETINSTTVPQLTISPSRNNKCFQNTFVTAATNWK